MRILSVPRRIVLRAGQAHRLLLIVHNDGESDSVCQPAIEGLADRLHVTFEPQRRFLESRCAGKFEVRIEAASGRTAAQTYRLAWAILAGGRAVLRAPLVIVVEAHRSVSARLEGGAVPKLTVANDGRIVESLQIEAHGDVALPAHSLPRFWTLSPGSRISIPIEFDRARAEPATLCISGGPQAILVETPIVQSTRAARAQRLRRTMRIARKALVGAGALAASLLIALGSRERLIGHSVALSDGIVAQAMPFVAIAAAPSLIDVRGADRLIGARVLGPARVEPRVHVAVREPQRSNAVVAAVVPPRVTDLRAPQEVASGGRFAISFRSRDASSVRVVAKIGPTIIRTFVVRSANGHVELRAPRAGRESRLMTVRVYARNDNRIATRETLVAILPS